MLIEQLYHDGAQIDFDIEDLRLLRKVFFSIDFPKWEYCENKPLEAVALQAIGTAFHAAVVACEHLPERAQGEVTP